MGCLRRWHWASSAAPSPASRCIGSRRNCRGPMRPIASTIWRDSGGRACARAPSSRKRGEVKRLFSLHLNRLQGRHLRPFLVGAGAVEIAGQADELAGLDVERLLPGLGLAQELDQAALELEAVGSFAPQRDRVELAVLGIVDVAGKPSVSRRLQAHDELMAEQRTSALV